MTTYFVLIADYSALFCRPTVQKKYGVDINEMALEKKQLNHVFLTICHICGRQKAMGLEQHEGYMLTIFMCVYNSF